MARISIGTFFFSSRCVCPDDRRPSIFFVPFKIFVKYEEFSINGKPDANQFVKFCRPVKTVGLIMVDPFCRTSFHGQPLKHGLTLDMQQNG